MTKCDDLPEMLLRPVGIVRNETKRPSLVAESRDLKRRTKIEKAKEERNVISEIIIDSKFSGILSGIEDFSHILVLYWAHRIPPEGRSLIMGHPMGRKDFPLVGIFATCSPTRPNPICVTTVRLLERRGNVLKVKGLDAVDGSPIIDIKPYNPSYYPAGDVKIPDWMERIYRDIAEESFPHTSSE